MRQNNYCLVPFLFKYEDGGGGGIERRGGGGNLKKSDLQMGARGKREKKAKFPQPLCSSWSGLNAIPGDTFL